ncbi:SigE family RNA polymerase sigma factor [Nocardioides sp. HDW12B]|nr:SigE family RNA polymerase sigma factor [Nocardioides sp. HDW12B]
MRRSAEHEASYVEYVTARQAHLRRIAHALCGDWHLADDLVQVALTKLYVAWPRVAAMNNVDAYARRVLVSTNIDHHRRRAARPETPTEVLPDPGSHDRDVGERDQLVAALQQLPEMQRKTVVLRHVLGLSVEETAYELDISVGTVKSHTSRARSAMRLALTSDTRG